MVLDYQTKKHPVGLMAFTVLRNCQCSQLIATVNFFLGAVGVIQVSRILMWRSSVKNESPKDQVEAAKESLVGTAQGLKDDVVSAVKKA
jgi:hypothetical protein